MTLTVESTVVEPFSLELTTPLRTAAGELDSRRGFLVGVESTVDGESVRGVGEATPLAPWTESYEECRAALEDATSPGDVGDSSPAAAHGLELAELDAIARAREVPLVELLVDRVDVEVDPPGAVATNATLGDGDTEATVEAAERAVESGFDVLKVKVGARSIEADTRRVRSVAEAVDARLRIDANGAWDADSVVDALDGLRGLPIEYVEQPLPAEDLVGHGALRSHGVTVAVDESLAETGLRRVLDAGAADVGVWKPMVHGGPEATLSLAHQGVEEGLTPVVTTTVDGAVARTAAVHVAGAVGGRLACGLATRSLLAEDLVPDPAPVEDGTVELPDGPGIAGDTFDDLLWG